MMPFLCAFLCIPLHAHAHTNTTRGWEEGFGCSIEPRFDTTTLDLTHAHASERHYLPKTSYASLYLFSVLRCVYWCYLLTYLLAQINVKRSRYSTIIYLLSLRRHTSSKVQLLLLPRFVCFASFFVNLLFSACRLEQLGLFLCKDRCVPARGPHLPC